MVQLSALSTTQQMLYSIDFTAMMIDVVGVEDRYPWHPYTLLALASP